MLETLLSNVTEEEIDESPTEYDESTWGKKVEGQFVIDGFKFKGKQSFRKTKEDLEKLMKRGVKGEINGSEFKILDARLKGIELEVDLQIIENKNGIETTGVGIIKLYGPNKRKENSITVTKSKRSDIKYVKIIAEKIIRPLIKKSLAVQNVEEKTIKQESIICEFCDKSFRTVKGMKGHITRVHKEIKQVEKADVIPQTVNMSDEEETDKEMIAEEVLSNIKEERKYSSECNECDFQVETKRKYALIQHMLKHKENCVIVEQSKNCKSNHKKGSCEVCGFIAKSEQNIKRHMRDKHDIMSVSTSPPPKKTKVLVDVNSHEDPEEMEIDGEDINEQMETNSLEKQRSKMMDEKVLSKAKKIEEEERFYDNKRKLKELKDKEIEEQQKEEMKKMSKQKKQKVKDEKKRMRKQSNKVEKIVINKVPNIKPVPSNLSHLVNKGDKVYVVPGDGSCAPSSVSAFLFGDEIYGRQLKQKMNRFMAEHWEKKYKYKTGCSKESPFIRNIGGGGNVVFTDSEKLIEYLTRSPEATFMWSDSEDLAIIADMFQVRIKVITTRGETDNNPTVNWIFPDEEMVEYADIKNVVESEIVLIHENESHFDLIVAEDSTLATKGSLSFRTNLGPFIEKNEVKEAKIIENDSKKDNNQSMEKEIKNLKEQLKKSNEKIEFMKVDYHKCDNELKSKTEELERLKIELQSLKSNISLEEKKRVIEIKCTFCNFKVKGKNQMEQHIKKHKEASVNSKFECSTQNDKEEYLKMNKEDKIAEDVEYNCNECSLQATSNSELKKHIRIKHMLSCAECDFYCNNKRVFETHKLQIHSNNCITCRICGENFETKSNMMSHRKTEHPKSVADCDKYKNGECRFSSKTCWWSHDLQRVVENRSGDVFKCFTCKETFTNKSRMMLHKKEKHRHLVRSCIL